LRRLFLTLALIAALTSCAKEKNTDYSLHLDEAQIDGPQTLGLSEAGKPVTGLVVYFHGSDQTARVIRDDEKHRNLFDSLLRNGYAVVAADAGGNAFGNPPSRNDYRRLIVAARSKYGVVPLTFVAESMGALPALALLSEARDRSVKGMVGISPLVGVPAQARAVSYIEEPWGGSVPDSADPMSWRPQTFAGRVFRFYIPDDDHVIPAGATGTEFAARFGSSATVQIEHCTGGHVDSACYRGADVEKWITDLE
jgi:pimeloyl-ACP methyl ester carboxylesterase